MPDNADTVICDLFREVSLVTFYDADDEVVWAYACGPARSHPSPGGYRDAGHRFEITSHGGDTPAPTHAAMLFQRRFE